MKLFEKFWHWRKPLPVDPETPCKICGHAAKDHNAIARKGTPHEFVVEGCGVIDIAKGPHPPWTWDSLFAGQHKPCRCKWDGKSRQV
jgi:hypothetical protein